MASTVWALSDLISAQGSTGHTGHDDLLSGGVRIQCLAHPCVCRGSLGPSICRSLRSEKKSFVGEFNSDKLCVGRYPPHRQGLRTGSLCSAFPAVELSPWGSCLEPTSPPGGPPGTSS